MEGDSGDRLTACWPDPLRTRLGRADLPLVRMGLGTASMAGVNMVGATRYRRPADTAVERILGSTARWLADPDSGRVMLDTSAQYGESELRIGAYFAGKPAIRDQFVIATKWGLRFHPRDFSRCDFSPANLRASTAASARRLGRIDLLYLHTNPGVETAEIVSLLDGRDGIIEEMCAMKRRRQHGIRALGLSVSTADTMERLVSEPRLLAPLDVVQLNANILLDRPDLGRALAHFDMGIVLNSPIRKGDRSARASAAVRRFIFHRLLDAAYGTLVLTGTIDPDHLRENIGHMKSWDRAGRLDLRYLSAGEHQGDAEVERAVRSLFPQSGSAALTLRRGQAPNRAKGRVDADRLGRIADLLIGSRKTRIGRAPSFAQRAILIQRVAAYVERGRPIAAILTWGPRKFRAEGADNSVDVSELAALNRLAALHGAVADEYAPGMRFSLFLEDFEGCYIEDERPEAFSPYLCAFDRLVAVLGLDGIIRTVHTLDLVSNHECRARVHERLEEDRRAIERYWIDSERHGIDASRGLASYRAMEELGFRGPIGIETRRFYLQRLDRLLGDARSPVEKRDMTIRLLACVLLHRQVGMFDLHDGAEPIKLSLLPIAGGPASLMDGRIDIRTLPTDVTKRCLAPWSSKGYLRWRGGRVVPALTTWTEALGDVSRFAPGELAISRGGTTVVVRADYRRSADRSRAMAAAAAR
jgi:aryl-alcohol dehydrogenase-like predicted oxidoreductase